IRGGTGRLALGGFTPASGVGDGRVSTGRTRGADGTGPTGIRPPRHRDVVLERGSGNRAAGDQGCERALRASGVWSGRRRGARAAAGARDGARQLQPTGAAHRIAPRADDTSYVAVVSVLRRANV